MKTPLMLVFALLLINCGATRQVAIDSTRPADINIDPSIQKLLIVNRADGSKNFLNTVEGILTGELLNEDKAAVQAFIVGLDNQLQFSPRFQTQVATEVLAGNSLTRSFPEPISWWMIEAICEEYNSDAVLAIEILDTDFIITQTKKMIVVENKEGQKVKVAEYHADGVANMTLGVRMYNPRTKAIIDQDLFRQTNSWESVSRSEAEALAKLISKADASSYLANQVGRDYAYRIAPMPVQLNRSFVGKAKKAPAVEQGARFADVGQWNQAIEVWENGLNTAPEKESGILAYNIAIAYEILGNMDASIQWAQRSYTQYGNNKGKHYYHQLLRRIDNESLAEEQMKQ